MVFVVRQRGRLKNQANAKISQQSITIPDGCVAKRKEDDVQSVLCKSASQ
jgi:hypothetical protein